MSQQQHSQQHPLDQIEKQLSQWQRDIRPDLFIDNNDNYDNENIDDDDDDSTGWVQRHSVHFNRSQLLLTMNLDLDFSFTYPQLTILVPENYPHGPYTVIFPATAAGKTEEMRQYGKGGILQLLEKVFHDLEDMRNLAIEDLTPIAISPTPHDESNRSSVKNKDQMFDDIVKRTKNGGKNNGEVITIDDDDEENDENIENDDDLDMKTNDENDDENDEEFDDEDDDEDDDDDEEEEEICLDIDEDDLHDDDDLMMMMMTGEQLGGYRLAVSKSNLDRDVQRVIDHGGMSAMYRDSGLDQLRIYLFIDPKQLLDISIMVASAWGIDLDRYIGISLTFSQYYLNADNIPEIDVFQCGGAQVVDERQKTQFHNILDNRSPFGLYWTVQEKLRNQFFKRYWPFQTYYNEVQSKSSNNDKNYMISVIETVIDIIKKSPQFCLICERVLPYQGLKPTVCDSPLCVFSHEEYGLGVNLENSIKNDPDLVDLAITMTHAATTATTARFNPFHPFPSTLEVKRKSAQDPTVIETHNFITLNGERDNQKVRVVLDLVPSVEKLSQWVDEGKLKDNCDELNPLLYPLLRWILASNRSHLKKLEPHEQISEMKTKFQYCLMSSTPEREKRFQELKQQYGSVYAFHGSSLCNWHSIMREGLKNMSGTAGQVNGAAYGSGV